MSYQVLARKWRPRNFREMVGQGHVLQALINALDQNRLHHAYLFTGTRGVGKTTVARIFAKCLNCEAGISSRPCGQCAACQQIDAGSFIDLIEVDAASRTRVEDTREILDNVQYAPTSGRYKVYLIDEVHMLSGHSFNALLKTLEEPPPHVKFLLATTDPQKLPVTILSRCLQFNLKAMAPDRIVEHLKHVLEQEAIQNEEPALWEIARSANGSMRDALSLTDQAIAYGNGQLLSEEVRSMLGTVDRHAVLNLLQLLAGGDAGALLDAVTALSEFSPDYGDVLAEMIGLLHRITIAQAVPDYRSDAAESDYEAQMIRNLAGQIAAEDVQLYYQIALMGRKDLPLVPEPRHGLEMILLRMLLFRPQNLQEKEAEAPPIDGTDGEPDHDAHGNDKLKASPTAGLQSVKSQLADIITDARKKNGPEIRQAPGEHKKKLSTKPDQIVDVAPRVAETKKPSELLEKEPIQSPVEMQSYGFHNLQDAPWDQLLATLELTGAALNLAKNCSLEGGKGSENTFHLVLDSRHAILLQPAREQAIKEALEKRLGHSVKVKFELGNPRNKTPHQLDDERQAQAQAAAESSIENDPAVQAIIMRFDGRVEVGSVKPRINH